MIEIDWQTGFPESSGIYMIYVESFDTIEFVFFHKKHNSWDNGIGVSYWYDPKNFSERVVKPAKIC